MKNRFERQLLHSKMIMNNRVSIEYERSGSALEWVKLHCPTYITNDAHIIDDIIMCDFYFDDSELGQREMVLFTLMWA